MKLLSLLVVLLASPTLWAQNLKIANLNNKIHNAGADWVAGETSVSNLSLAEMKKLLGAGLDPHPDVVFSVPESAQINLQSTSGVDWRNYNGKNWVTPIKNQGACGSCVAFASVETFETQYRITAGRNTMTVNLSPQFLFSCGGGSCNDGWMPEEAASFLKSKGTPDESCMPYTSGKDGNDVSCSKACSNASKISWRIAGFSTPTKSVVNLNAIKAALKTGPLVTTMSVYSDFMNYKSGIYKHVSGGYLGGHAISIVGYDDVKRAFIIRNSWGTKWGENGFIRISYDDSSGIGASTWKYAVTPTRTFNVPSLDSVIADATSEATTPAVAPSEIDTNPELSATLSESQDSSNVLLEASSQNAFAEVEMHQKYRGKEMRVLTIPMNEAALNVKLKTEQWKNGEWEVYFVGRNKADAARDQVESEHYFINVRN